MRVLRLAAIALLLYLLLPSPAKIRADTLGDARVGFAADRILTIDGHSYKGRMWHMPGEQRHEQELPTVRPIFILRSHNSLGDIVLPQLHTVVEFSLPEELSLLAGADLLRKPLGQEMINGVATTEYAVEEDTSAGRATGLLWLSSDGIPMRCDGQFVAKNGKTSTVHWELAHVTIGQQDPALFEVPQGYAKLPPEAVQMLLGMHLAPPSSR